MSEELNLVVEMEIKVYDKKGNLIYTNKNDTDTRRSSKVQQKL